MISMNRVKGLDQEVRSIDEVAELYAQDLHQGKKSSLKTAVDRIKEIRGNTPEQKCLLKWLSNEGVFQHILLAKPHEMKGIINFFTPLNKAFLEKDADGKDFGERIIDRLGYERYRDNGDKMHKLLNWLGLKSCPYCNSQYILTIDSVKNGKLHKKALFQLDHYYPKSKYPYLAVSFYNLIPSCSYCNNSKNDRDPFEQETIHPYFDDYDDLCKFSIEPESIINYRLTQKGSPKIELNIIGEQKAKVKQHNKDFHLEALYQQNHADLAEELYWKSLYYTKDRRAEITSLFENTEVKLSENEINRFITGNYVQKEDILKRPLSKLTKDLAEELGLL